MPPSPDTDRIGVKLTQEKTVFSPQSKQRAAEENSILYFLKAKIAAFFFDLKQS